MESHKIPWLHYWLLYPMEYPIKNTFSYPIKKPCSSHHQPVIDIPTTIPSRQDSSQISSVNSQVNGLHQTWHRGCFVLGCTLAWNYGDGCNSHKNARKNRDGSWNWVYLSYFGFLCHSWCCQIVILWLATWRCWCLGRPSKSSGIRTYVHQ